MENAVLIVCALLLTIVVEGAVLLLLGEKRCKVFIASVVINIITNVPLNLVIQHTGMNLTAVVVGETAVVIIEAIWYYLFVRRASQAAVYSLLCNAVSFLTGFILTSTGVIESIIRQ